MHQAYMRSKHTEEWSTNNMMFTRCATHTHTHHSIDIHPHHSTQYTRRSTVLLSSHPTPYSLLCFIVSNTPHTHTHQHSPTKQTLSLSHSEQHISFTPSLRQPSRLTDHPRSRQQHHLGHVNTVWAVVCNVIHLSICTNHRS
jgi:hypothetical protein